jgi:hypothetical protein
MNTEAVDQIMQYALAVASEAEDWRERELRPIHLIKYVYLADLAWASRNGETYTRAPWRFYKFGPYCLDVLERVSPAMEAINAIHRTFPSDYRDEDIRCWKSSDRRDLEIGERLPPLIQNALKREVMEWGSDTKGLLHHVYTTSPMLNAAPGEDLEFRGTSPRRPPAEKRPLPTARQIKKRQAKIADVREKLEERRANRPPRRSKPMIDPRYDDVYSKGVEWLDSLAGDPVEPKSGILEIDPSIWHSETRGWEDEY